MAGRRIMLPDQIVHIYTTDERTGLAVYALKPSCLISKYYVPGSEDSKHQFSGLDNGNLFWPSLRLEKLQQDYETAAHAPSLDIILAVVGRHDDPAVLEKSLIKFGLPVIFLRLNQLDDYPAAFALLGQLTREEFHAAELSSYIEGALQRIRMAHLDVPQHRRVHVYYDDLVELIALQRLRGELKSDFFPEFLISHDSSFADNLKSAAQQHRVKAAAFGKVVTVPNMPLNWIDSSPTLMQLLGLQWLAHTFYPEAFPMDLAAETKYFYRLFLHRDLSDEELEEILHERRDSKGQRDIKTLAPM